MKLQIRPVSHRDIEGVIQLSLLVLQRYLSPEAVLTTWKQACNRSV